MIQIKRTGVAVSATERELDRLSEEFGRRHCVLLKNFFEPELLADIRRRVDDATFLPRTDDGIATELCLSEPVTAGLLNLLVNRQDLFRVVQRVTGCGRIGSFQGRVYRFHGKLGHHDSWHDDMIDNRLIALSVNLGRGVYSGGLLQIRESESGRIVHEVANTGFGDALIFRIARGLRHRVTNVEGEVPKEAFAGWFKSQPDFLAHFKAGTGV